MLDTPCDRWPGPFYSNGYGRDCAAGRPAHVVAWVAAVGEIPAGFVLDHECHNLDPHCPAGKQCPHRGCREIEHLVLRTIGDNARRGWRTRATCGRGHPWTEANTYWRPDNGRRMCRRCCQLRQQREPERDPNYHAKARARSAANRARRRSA